MHASLAYNFTKKETMVQEFSFAKLFKIAFSAEYLTGTTSGLPLIII